MLEEYQGKDDWMTPAEKISTNYAFTMFSRKKGSSGLNEYLSNFVMLFLYIFIHFYTFS